MRRQLFALAAAACALVCSSCGPSGLYPVTGKVFVNGEPAVGATVSFVRKGAADPLKEPNAQGVVGEDGTFTLSGPGGAGAPAGDYVVLIEWKEGAGKARGRAPALSAPDRLKKKYLDADKPLLTATVEPKSNALPPFELN
ncbi:hypothetical protein [Frigoriglobus tundricola]|uniref:Carboxypeptidase regulatory-like domain-containing protein n=1 Tax=Frigoriglobus tundricola TaxID=2774151 RepID=A0A6M5Z1A4_9BACT|nr:hypothetical protein [Frigoriglobus tundricola]QJW99420.1 hypothetical protein FTUN_7032 [Frigoriglobus tundricola]